ncbi:MAG: DNA-3-methyladenine glycosylase I [Ruminococcaceae bacterium]|nr:DNA-3-methyladenine glycosylase I [Oscillospiraceae bacterium]
MNSPENKKRCFWCNLKNPIYVEYHDKEWGRPRFDDTYLFEMLVLESFQAGLSWECVLNKRQAFREAFDFFDASRVALYGEEKLTELLNNKSLIRNKLKMRAAVSNARIFVEIVVEMGSFYNYLRSFWDGHVVTENDKTSSPLSDAISFDLRRRGMTFVGTKIVYSYLQAIGVIDSHGDDCFLNLKNKNG